jgi:hypothetical protein
MPVCATKSFADWITVAGESKEMPNWLALVFILLKSEPTAFLTSTFGAFDADEVGLPPAVLFLQML